MAKIPRSLIVALAILAALFIVGAVVSPGIITIQGTTTVAGSHTTGALHVAGISNIGSGNTGTGTTAMACHSTLAIHMAGGSTAVAQRVQIIHLTSSNGGVDQSTWRIYICGLLLYGNSGNYGRSSLGAVAESFHSAAGISLVEGLGTTCVTGQLPVLGQINDGSLLVGHVAGNLQVVSPFPWIATMGPGNNLCIMQSARSATQYTTGAIIYRAGP